MNRITTPLDALRPYLPIAVRLVLGYLLIRHGLDKFDTGLSAVGDAFDGWGVPLPDASATFVALLEVVGGFALVAGIATRFVAIASIAMLFGALYFVKAEMGVLGGSETDLAYIAGLASLVATGPGRWALDVVVGLESSTDVGDTPDRQLVDA